MAKSKENEAASANVTPLVRSESPSRGQKKNQAIDSLGGCLSQGCRTRPTHLSFCDEHYDQFKFGLIKKTGEPVSDFEKKYEHYQNYKHKLPKAA